MLHLVIEKFTIIIKGINGQFTRYKNELRRVSASRTAPEKRGQNSCRRVYLSDISYDELCKYQNVH